MPLPYRTVGVTPTDIPKGTGRSWDQDAVNLGLKLAQVVKGTSPDSLLDTYHAERHPVAARALRNTMVSVALRRADDRTQALRDTTWFGPPAAA